MDRRVNALENPKASRAGSWVFSDRDGDLWASAPGRPAINFSALAAFMAGFTPVIEQTGVWRRTVTIFGGATGGSFVLYYNEMPTANIAYNASAATVATRIIDLSTDLDASKVLVSAPSSGGPWTIVAPSGSLTATWDNLTGGTDPYVEIA